jgi:hypothetical protein
MTAPKSQDWSDDPERAWGKCDQCGREAWVVMMDDPATAECDRDENEENQAYWCEECAIHRAGET